MKKHLPFALSLSKGERNDAVPICASTGSARTVATPAWLKQVKFDSHGLVPAVVQDAASGQVLMVAYMNEEALLKTLKTGKTHFYSRSRKKIWLKGETSGHWQKVKEIRLDCDGDTVLVKATQVGGACHEGYQSCFFRKMEGDRRWRVADRRIFDPKRIYGK